MVTHSYSTESALGVLMGDAIPNRVVLRILVAKIIQEWLRAEWPACNVSAQIARAIMLTRVMNLFIEPGLEPGEPALLKITVQIAQLPPGSVHELGGIEIA